MYFLIFGFQNSDSNILPEEVLPTKIETQGFTVQVTPEPPNMSLDGPV